MSKMELSVLKSYTCISRVGLAQIPIPELEVSLLFVTIIVWNGFGKEVGYNHVSIVKFPVPN